MLDYLHGILCSQRSSVKPFRQNATRFILCLLSLEETGVVTEAGNQIWCNKTATNIRHQGKSQYRAR